MTAAPRTPARPKRPRAAAARTTETNDPPAFTPLKTERLTLRPFRPEDAAALHRLINHFDIARMLELVRFPYHRELADEFIESSTKNLATGAAVQLAITGHENDHETLVGGVGISIDRAARTGRLGYWVGQKYWGHGVATEAAARLTSYAFANLEIDRITAGVATDNPASAAVLRRIGFRQTGTANNSVAAAPIAGARLNPASRKRSRRAASKGNETAAYMAPARNRLTVSAVRMRGWLQRDDNWPPCQ